MTVRIIHADCREAMAAMPDNTAHAIVTDPPYGLKFMGKGWDHGVPGAEFWREALRVARPGAPLLAFGGSRTFHRLWCAVEDAGWELRDSLFWIHGQGMPKTSLVDGYAQDLKPAVEPVVLARKKLDGTVAQNAQRWGVGGLWVDGCRIGETPGVGGFDPNLGRWPANLVLDEAAAAMLDAEVGELTSGANPTRRSAHKFDAVFSRFVGQQECVPHRGAETGGPSRFYYCAKATPAERGEYNTHSTVKPLALMQWLVRLVKPPRGGVILDPFCGSGTTGIAATREGLVFIGIEQDAAHVEIARRRIADDAPLSNQSVGGPT
jgi:site-specific DNA-methyltransferase (adenine-specific)